MQRLKAEAQIRLDGWNAPVVGVEQRAIKTALPQAMQDG
jgi:hypothetical protein